MPSEQDPLLDFRNFLDFTWNHLRLPLPSRRQSSIAHWLQHGPDRQVTEAFRGIGKSWVTAAFVAWCLWCNPQMNILVVSASKQRADNFTTFVLRLIYEIPLLQHLAPRPDQRCSKVSFDVGPAGNSQTPSVVSLGVTSSLTGNRADLIIADDVEVPNNSATLSMREKLSELIKEFDAILKPNGRIIYLGTPQTEGSIYNLLPDRGYTIRIWPALYPTEAERANYADRLAPDILEDIEADPLCVGHTTEPRFTDADLEERKLSYGRAGFGLQFMLDTRLSDADRYPLRLRDLVVMSLGPDLAPERVVWGNSPENVIEDVPVVGMGRDRYYRPLPVQDTRYIPYQGKVLAIDPAGRGKDETGWAVLGVLHSYIYLLDSGGFDDGYSKETLQGLAMTAKKWGVNSVVVEANFGDGMYTQLLKPVMTAIHPCSIEEVKHSKQKEARIVDTLEPVISTHRFIVNQELIEKDYKSTEHRPQDTAQRYQLFYQMTRLTRERGALMSDDRIDAVSMGVAHFVESMAMDEDKAMRGVRERELRKELDTFARHVFGHKPKEMTWGSCR